MTLIQDISLNRIYEALSRHLRRYFAGHKTAQVLAARGPLTQVLPRFQVMQIAPGSKTNLWVYASVGAWEVVDSNNERFELMILAPEQNPRQIEILAMTAYYHANPQTRLGLGHTFPLGEPWLKDSHCDYFLVCHPYAFTPELEICKVSPFHIHMFQLLPITKAERDFKARHGLEELEKRFEDAGLEYWQPKRKSVV